MKSRDAGSSTSLRAEGSSALRLLLLGSSNWVSAVVYAGSMLIVTPVLLSHLGNTEFGIWALVNSLVGFYGLLRLGVGAGMMRYLPYYLRQFDALSASRTVSSGFAIYALVALLIVGTSQLIADPIAEFYGAGAPLAALVRIIGVAAAVECIWRLLDSCVRAHEAWIPANVVEAVSAIVYAAAVVGCAYAGFGLVELGYVSVASAVLTLILMTIVYLRTCTEITLHPRFVSREFLRKLLIFGLFTTVATLAYTLALSGHRFIVGKMVSLEAVAFYAVASALVASVQRAAIGPVQTFWPRFAALDAAKFREETAELFLRGTRYSALLSGGMIAVLVVASPSFISLWLGADYVAPVMPVLVVLSAGYLIATSTESASVFLAGTGRQAMQAGFAAMEGLIGVALSLFLGLRLGALGVALGFLLSVAVMRGCVRIIYVCPLTGNSARSYFLRSLAPSWLIGVAIVGCAYASDLARSDYGLVGLVTLVAATAVLYAALAWLLVIGRDEKRELLEGLRRLLSKRTSGPGPASP